MHVIARRTLVAFWEKHTSARQALEAWYDEVDRAYWKSSADIKQRYATASIISHERVVFNICGNRYRLIARINFTSGTVFVRFIGTHKEYDRVNVEEV